MAFKTKGTLYCPRCDRKFLESSGPLRKRVEALKKHVRDNHPDYDPEWYDTYPHKEED